MKKVLLVAFAYPPLPYIGSIRPGALAKYLPKFGWEAVVLTPRYGEGKRPPFATVIETDYADVIANLKAKLRLDPQRGLHQQLNLPQHNQPGRALPHTKVIAWLKSLLSFPDETRGWLPSAMAEVQRLGTAPTVDAILSTSPPVSTHLIAAAAKKKLGVPWVADLRDLWVAPETSHWGMDLLQRRLERKTFSSADAIVTVSENWAQFLSQRHSSKTVYWALTGFDPDEYANQQRPLTSTFSITYTGILYQGKRDPTLLFEVLQELLHEKLLARDEVRVRFYGRCEPWLVALVERFQLQDVVELRGSVSREESLASQQEAQLLLLLGMNVASDAGCYPGKLFEYLAAGRPIVALGGLRGALTNLLNDTKAGLHVFSKLELRNYLLDSYRQFRRCGRVEYAGVPARIAQYTQLALAQRFAAVLDGVSTGRKPSPSAISEETAYSLPHNRRDVEEDIGIISSRH